VAYFPKEMFPTFAEYFGFMVLSCLHNIYIRKYCDPISLGRYSSLADSDHGVKRVFLITFVITY
jgi:hypothetical protein